MANKHASKYNAGDAGTEHETAAQKANRTNYTAASKAALSALSTQAKSQVSGKLSSNTVSDVVQQDLSRAQALQVAKTESPQSNTASWCVLL